MKLQRLLTLALLMSMIAALNAQDLHFTQFYMSPLTMNPAQSGAFSGTFRIGGIYRDQQNYISGINGYRTPSLYVDAPIIRGFRKTDWIGVGASLVQDKAGTGGLTTGLFGLSLAYHLALDKKRNSVLAIGGGMNFSQRKLSDPSALEFEDNLLGTGNVDGNKLQQLQDGVNFSDYVAGLSLTTKAGKKTNLNIGAAYAHVSKPNYSLFSGTNVDRPSRITAHAKAIYDANEKWLFTPALMYQSSVRQNELSMQVLAGYKLKPDVTLHFGPGYRVNDAAKIILGMDYKSLRAGLAYDINISDLSAATNGHGAFELAVSYIAKIYKKPVVKPVIFCPKF